MKKTALFSALLCALPVYSKPNPRFEYTSKIAIIVNKDSITERDIEDRIRLVMFTSDINDASAKDQLRPQVIKSLMEELIQMQKGKELKVFVSDAEVDNHLKNIAAENGKSLDEMKRLFKASNVNVQSLKSRIRAQLTWAQIIRGAFGRTVTISPKEIQNEKRRIQKSLNMTKYEFLEIVLRASDAKEEVSVKNNANRLVQQIKNGADFKALAQQFSNGNTAKDGGLQNGSAYDIDPDLESTLATLPLKGVSKPIKTSRGYVIVKLLSRDKSAGQKGDTTASFSTIVIPESKLQTEDQHEAVSRHLEALKNTTSQKTFELEAEALGYTVERLNKINVLGFPEPLQNVVKAAKINTLLPPVREPDGLRVLMLTDRKFVAYAPPTEKEIVNIIEQRKFGKISQRESNKLKSSAYVRFLDPRFAVK